MRAGYQFRQGAVVYAYRLEFGLGIGKVGMNRRHRTGRARLVIDRTARGNHDGSSVRGRVRVRDVHETFGM